METENQETVLEPTLSVETTPDMAPAKTAAPPRHADAGLLRPTDRGHGGTHPLSNQL